MRLECKPLPDRILIELQGNRRPSPSLIGAALPYRYKRRGTTPDTKAHKLSGAAQPVLWIVVVSCLTAWGDWLQRQLRRFTNAIAVTLYAVPITEPLLSGLLRLIKHAYQLISAEILKRCATDHAANLLQFDLINGLAVAIREQQFH